MQDPEEVARLILVGRDALMQIQEKVRFGADRYNAVASKNECDVTCECVNPTLSGSMHINNTNCNKTSGLQGMGVQEGIRRMTGVRMALENVCIERDTSVE